MALVGNVAWELNETILLATRSLGWVIWAERLSFTLLGQITGASQTSRTERNKSSQMKPMPRAQFQPHLVTGPFLANYFLSLGFPV